MQKLRIVEKELDIAAAASAVRRTGATTLENHPRPSKDAVAAKHFAIACTFAVVVAAGFLVIVPLVTGVQRVPWQMAGVVVLFFGLFVTRAVPDHMAALILLFAAGAIVRLPLDIVFAGFHSNAAWIIFAGLLIGAGITETGLGGRVAHAVLRRTGSSYGSVIYSVFLSGALLIFLLPTAVGRIVLLVPIAVAIADKLGFEAGSRGRNGIVLAAVLGTMLPAYAVLPSILPNVVMLGTAQTLYGIEFSYVQYFVAIFPALAVPTLICAPWLLIRLFPAACGLHVVDNQDGVENERAATMSWILTGALALWATDFLHGIPPVWIALAAALACLAPRIGTIRSTPFNKCVHIGPWLLIASVVSLATMIEYSGLGAVAGRELIATLDLRPGADALNFAKVVGASTVAGVLTTSIASPAVMTSLAQTIASAAGWPIEAVLLAQVPTWFFIVLPYQTPIMVIGLAMGGVPVGAAARYLIRLAALGFAVATPLYFLWLRALGYLP